jgi:CheY-specific phosphatase CheX
MPTELLADVGPAEFAQIVADVFDTMMGLAVTECEEPWFQSADRLIATVHLSGQWSGVVIVDCNRMQFCRLAGRFLSMDAPVDVDDVVRDVAGELANMIGGNLKCILCPGIRLSMPSVVDGSDYSLRVCGSHAGHTLAFDCEEGVFWVRVLRQHEA